ncbi:MAG: hypothetical protein CMQ43_01260 [Gammaproteobacteria bacterium]|nr:hypothetical protein [Gammaproteobacteria bacterium]|tara:strand:+ start:7728 stop:8669 length:942 start_codon:yes stop_codon:yes gene_type:complete
MLRGPIADPDFKGQFSGHETFPLRHLWLRKAYDAVSKGREGAPRSLFSSPEAIVTFGVGKNMATSIRHWALACDVIREEGEHVLPGPLGSFLFDSESGRDPFMESPATTWILHWLIAGRPERTTTWYYAFNHFSPQTFTREDLAELIRRLCKERGWTRSSAATLKRDVECFIRTYVSRLDSRMPDDSMEPVLTELGLIRPVSGRTFEFRSGPKASLPDGVFLFALNDFWLRSAPDQRTFAVETLAYEPGSPGRVFRLDEQSLIERLARIGDSSEGRFVWSDTAGVRSVARRVEEIEGLELLDLAYDTEQRSAA